MSCCRTNTVNCFSNIPKFANSLQRELQFLNAGTDKKNGYVIVPDEQRHLKNQLIHKTMRYYVSVTHAITWYSLHIGQGCVK